MREDHLFNIAKRAIFFNRYNFTCFNIAKRAIFFNRYNLTCSDTRKYVWFRVAKVCTRSILNVLERNSEFTENGSWIYYRRRPYKDYFRFAFVRNPWDRVVSCYEEKVIGRKLFPDCWGENFKFFVKYICRQDLRVADRHIRLQSSLFPLRDVNFIGRFESFTEDFSYVCKKLNFPYEDHIHLNRSKHEPFHTYYDEEDVALINQAYAIDVKNFGYKFLST
ncbi:MAG: sulfotransferase family 2 domain-containing protein [Nitrososphaera sp.]